MTRPSQPVPCGQWTKILVFIATFAIASPAFAEESLLERDVLPILTKQCLGCHGGLRQKGGLDLRTVPLMLKGGDSGPAIEPGGPCVTPEPAEVEVSDTMQSWIDSSRTAACRSAVCAVPILCKGRFLRANVAGQTDNISVFLAAGGRHTCFVTF